jgi:hypothetical protein
MKLRIAIVTTVSLALFAFFLAQIPHAGAFSSGIIGFSGQSGAYCIACHNDASATVPTVTLSGPTFVLGGTTNTYQLKISGGQALNPTPGLTPGGGLNVAASAGDLNIVPLATDTQLIDSQIAHTMRKDIDGQGNVTFAFEWTAPITPTIETLYGAGNSVNGDGTNQGDAAETTTLVIHVVDELLPPQNYMPIVIK